MLGVAATYLGPTSPSLMDSAAAYAHADVESAQDRGLSHPGLAREEHQRPAPVEGARPQIVERVEKPSAPAGPPRPMRVPARSG